MCLIILGALLLSQSTIFYGTPTPTLYPSLFLVVYSVYMHEEGKRKSNDIKYVQVNKTKMMIYCRSSKLNGTITFFFWTVDQIQLW